jgi:hypothetical protein
MKCGLLWGGEWAAYTARWRDETSRVDGCTSIGPGSLWAA